MRLSKAATLIFIFLFAQIVSVASAQEWHTVETWQFNTATCNGEYVNIKNYKYLYDDGFLPNKQEWTEIGNSPWLDAPDDGNYLKATVSNAVHGNFTVQDLPDSAYEVLNVTLEVYLNTTYATSLFDVKVFIWDGSSWNLFQFHSEDFTWQTAEVTCLTTVEQVNNVQIYIDSFNYANTYHKTVDCIRLKVWYAEKPIFVPDYGYYQLREVVSASSGQWNTVGTSPYLNGTSADGSYIWTNNNLLYSQIFIFDSSLSSEYSTILEPKLTVIYKTSLETGNITLQYWFGKWKNLTLVGSTSWTTVNLSLPVLSPYRLPEFKIRFKGEGSGEFYVECAYLTFKAWKKEDVIKWLYKTMRLRQVNETTPLIKDFNEYTQNWDGKARIDLSSALLYTLTGDPEHLNFSKQVADWLSTKPIVRLFQVYDLNQKEWVGTADYGQLDVSYAALQLLRLCVLARLDSTYKPLLKKATTNFTRIFVKKPYYRVAASYVNGSWKLLLYHQTYSFDQARSIAALTYAGYLLNNQTLFDIAKRLILNYTLGAKNIPYHIIKTETGEDCSGYAKITTIGWYINAMVFYYYYTNDEEIKQRIHDVSYSIQYFYDAENRWFDYRVDPDTGDVVWNNPVKGNMFSYEALTAAYLICGNQSWIEWAKDDFISNLHNEWLVRNDVVVHTNVQLDSTLDRTSAAIRGASIFYNLDVPGFYRNSTIFEVYRKLYGGTTAAYKGSLGWAGAIDVTETEITMHLNARDSDLSILFRVFMNVTDETINSLESLYAVFGNPFTGEIGAPNPWHVVETWNFTLTTPPPSAWHMVESWNFTLATQKIWRTVETWQFNIETNKTWHTVETWLFNLKAPDWHTVESWNFSLFTPPPPTWNTVETWNFTLNATRTWKTIETWSFDLATPPPPTWNTVEIWNLKFGKGTALSLIEAIMTKENVMLSLGIVGLILCVLSPTIFVKKWMAGNWYDGLCYVIMMFIIGLGLVIAWLWS